MATNPKIPPEPYSHDDHEHVVLTKKRTSSWPVILVVIAAAVLIALLVWVIATRGFHRTPSPVGSVQHSTVPSRSQAPKQFQQWNPGSGNNAATDPVVNPARAVRRI